MRRLVIPAVVVVMLIALTVSGAYLLKGTLPISNPASATPGQTPEHSSSLASETFDKLRVSAAVPGGWKIVAGSGRFSVAAVPNRANKSGQLVATGSSSSVVACRALPSPHGATLTLSLDLRLDAAKPHDLLVLEVGPGTRPLAASVGVDRRGHFGYLDGGKQVSSDRPLSPKTWYQMTLVLHGASKTYDWQVLGQDGSVMFRRLNMRWNPGVRQGVDSLCLTAPPGPGTKLYVDNLEVLG
jgi:hypothetical protein